MRDLRKAGYRFWAVGVDLSSSIAHSGPCSWKPSQLKVRGVGSDDEVCRTLRLARQEIDEVVTADIFSGAEAMREFLRASVGCGMSGGLALAATARYVLDRCPEGRCVLVILPDRADLYFEELLIANQIFG